MPRQSKSKTIENKAILSLEDMKKIKDENEIEIAKEYHLNGHDEHVHIDPKTKEVLGLGNAPGRNRVVFDHLAKKFGATYKINQLVRQASGDGMGFLVVQGIGYTRDYSNNKVTHHFTYGFTEKLIWYAITDGFDRKTGRPIETGKEVLEIEKTYYMPFSEAQVKALSNYFDKLSLIVNTGTRKYTVTDLETFCKPYADLKAKVEQT